VESKSNTVKVFKSERGQAVKTNKVLYPFYWNYAGNPDIVIPIGAIGIVAHEKTQGDVIIDFPIDTIGLENTICNTLPVQTIWRVRMSLKDAAVCLEKLTTPEWLKFHFFCGSLELDCELQSIPSMFNRDVVTTKYI